MKDKMIKKNSISRVYYKLFVILLTSLSFLNVYSNSHNTYYGLLTIILGAIFLFFGLIRFVLEGLNLNKFLFVVFLLLIWLVTKFNSFFLVPIIITISFIGFSPLEIIKIYSSSNLYCLLLTILSALLGISPMKNPIDGVLSLGFSNENTLGLFMLLIASFYLLEMLNCKTYNKSIYYKVAFILLFIFMNTLITDDRTVVFVFLIFLLSSCLIRVKAKSLLKIMGYIACLFPAILTYGSWIAMKNYDNSNFYYALNKILSNRILMWNWFYHNVPITLFPSNLKVNQFNYWGTVDGSYALMLFQSGIMVTIIVCLLLILCNFQLIKKGYYSVFCLIFSLEVGAFSENILQSPVIVYVVVFALMSLYPDWLDKQNNLI